MLRSFRNNAMFSAINVAGFGVGLAACWLIAAYVIHEKSYDRFLPHADRICAVSFDLKVGQEEGHTTNTPPPLAPRLLSDYPEFELTARTFHLGSVVVRTDESGLAPQVFNEETAYAADSTFLELFEFPMTAGDPATALDLPGSLVMTEKTAKKYFGSQSPLGKTLLINDRRFTVRAIARDLPSNSSIQFDFLLPMADFKVVERFSWSWIWLQVDTWAKLRETPTPASLAALEAKFPTMVRTYAPAAYARIGQDLEANLRNGDRLDVKLLPLHNLHLGYPGLASRLQTIGDQQQVHIFTIAGAMIFLLACVNFMNLSTARSLKRAREVGVRKALGSQRSQLVGMFLMEAVWYSVAGLVLAAGLVALSIPAFNQLTGLSFQFSDFFTGPLAGAMLLLPLVCGLLGGLYPAFYLSGATSKIGSSSGKLSGQKHVRSGLVVFQFTISLILMLCAWIVFRQLEFAQQEKPGLQRANVLILPNVRHLETTVAKEAFRQELLKLPEVKNVTHSTFLPSVGSFGDFYEAEQTLTSGTSLLLSSFLTDMNFVPTLGIEIMQGRNFMADTQLDSTSVILNETAVKAFGWSNPIGQWIRYPGNENQRFQVVGVMRDFNLGSVRFPVEPTAIFHQSSKTYRTWGAYMAASLQPGTEKVVIDKVSALWKSRVPAAPFEFDFLDASFASLYRTESKTAAVLGVFTALALFIGCLGLFALAAFSAEQRTKEIGIRKVLGASVAGVTALLAGNFLKLVGLAILIATPIAWYFMQTWLADFAFRVDLAWWMFAVAGLCAIVIAFLTVSFQSIKAALANPVTSLKNE
ncbi:MAG: ABC transporter permease [Saprospiraceae bacterium]|nr:ABC transporter permease [Saprospiraceae bacterium]